MANQVSSIVTVAVAQAGLAFRNVDFEIDGIQAPYLEDTVENGTPLIVADGIGTLNHSNLKLLYIGSDQLDITVDFYTGTDGSTGHITPQLTIPAGSAYIFATSANGAVGSNPLGSSDCGSIKITATLNVKDVAQTAITETDIHVRTSLSA